MVKYGLLGDAAFFGWLERNGRRLRRGDRGARRTPSPTSVEVKADIVARDETETGRPRAAQPRPHLRPRAGGRTGYSDRLLHGEAVAIGICLAFDLSRGSACGRDAERARRRATRRRRPADAHRRHPGHARSRRRTLMALMGQDKKVRDGRLTFILARGIGAAFVSRDVPAATVQDFLARRIAAERG